MNPAELLARKAAASRAEVLMRSSQPYRAYGEILNHLRAFPDVYTDQKVLDWFSSAPDINKYIGAADANFSADLVFEYINAARERKGLPAYSRSFVKGVSDDIRADVVNGFIATAAGAGQPYDPASAVRLDIGAGVLKLQLDRFDFPGGVFALAFGLNVLSGPDAIFTSPSDIQRWAVTLSVAIDRTMAYNSAAVDDFYSLRAFVNTLNTTTALLEGMSGTLANHALDSLSLIHGTLDSNLNAFQEFALGLISPYETFRAFNRISLIEYGPVSGSTSDFLRVIPGSPPSSGGGAPITVDRAEHESSDPEQIVVTAIRRDPYADFSDSELAQALRLNANDPVIGPALAAAARRRSATNQNISAAGYAVGSALGNYLAGDNVFASLTASVALGTLTQNFAQAIRAGGFNRPVPNVTATGEVAVANSVNANIRQEFLANLRSAAAGTISSLLSLELGRVVGVSGFGGELLNTATSSVISFAADNVLAGRTIFEGLNGTGLFRSVNVDTGVVTGPGVLTSAISSFLGNKLGSLIISPVTAEGALFSSIGSTVGSIYGGAITSALFGNLFGAASNFLAPGIGALIGTVVGTLLGRLFFGKPPKAWASSVTELNLTSGFWDMGASVARHGGNLDLVKSMAGTARETINGVIARIAGREDVAGNANTTSPKLKFYTDGGRVTDYKLQEWNGSAYVDRINVPAGTPQLDPSAIVDRGVFLGLRSTKIAGGDIYLKRALAASIPAGIEALNVIKPEADIPTLLGNLAVAEDFGRYMRDPEAINRPIAANPNSPFTAGWARRPRGARMRTSGRDVPRNTSRATPGRTPNRGRSMLCACG